METQAVLSIVDKSNFYGFARRRGSQQAKPSKLWPTLEWVLRSLRVWVRGHDQLVDLLWLVGSEVIGSWLHQPLISSQSAVYMLVSSIELTYSTCWGFQYLQNRSKDMASINCNPWGKTKGPWLCLMAKVLLFCLACLFFSLCIFSVISLNLFFDSSFSTNKRQAEDIDRGLFRGSCSVTLYFSKYTIWF